MVNSSTPSALSLAACSELKPSARLRRQQDRLQLDLGDVYGWRNTGSPLARVAAIPFPASVKSWEHLIAVVSDASRLGRRTEESSLLVRARLRRHHQQGDDRRRQAQRHP